MKQKNALVLAGGLTAFVLVTLGAVLGGPAIVSAASPASNTDATVIAVLQQREAAYSRMLDQANNQLQTAYDQIAQLHGTTSTAASAMTTYPVSADLAAGLALNVAPGAQLIRWPTLVDFQGTAAYEIVLDRGPVYIDATTARVLYNGTMLTANASLGGFSGEHEDDD